MSVMRPVRALPGDQRLTEFLFIGTYELIFACLKAFKFFEMN